MRLTIEMTSNTNFRIIEQDTGMVGYVFEPLYQDDFIAICQRAMPEFSTDSEYAKPVLYLRGEYHDADRKIIKCGSYICKVLWTLTKVFDEFKILNCNKFILEKHYD